MRHVIRRGRLPVEKIVEEIAGAYDRPRHQLREKADEQRIVDGIAHRLLFATIHIHYVRHALKGVKTDPQRKHDGQEPGIAGLAHQQGKVGGQKIVILEEPEKRQIRREAGNQHRLLLSGRPRSFQPDSRREIDRRQSQQQWNEVVIPCPVEVITGNQQNISADRPRAHIEEHQHHSQKDEKVDGVKEHSYCTAAMRSGGPSSLTTSSSSSTEKRLMPSRFRCMPSLRIRDAPENRKRVRRPA